MRYGTDHHASSFSRTMYARLSTTTTMVDGATMNQITWQVGSCAKYVPPTTGSAKSASR